MFIILSRVKDGVKVMNVADRAEISVIAILKKESLSFGNTVDFFHLALNNPSV